MRVKEGAPDSRQTGSANFCSEEKLIICISESLPKIMVTESISILKKGVPFFCERFGCSGEPLAGSELVYKGNLIDMLGKSLKS